MRGHARQWAGDNLLVLHTLSVINSGGNLVTGIVSCGTGWPTKLEGAVLMDSSWCLKTDACFTGIRVWQPQGDLSIPPIQTHTDLNGVTNV